MADRPIIFSAPMVRALLEGRKTQTRRLLRSMNRWVVQDCREVRLHDGRWCHFLAGAAEPLEHLRLPWSPGDRLWVRENWCRRVEDGAVVPGAALYAADGGHVVKSDGNGFTMLRADGREASPWRPSIHMPRWASRITLLVSDVRVQRLEEISEADAEAEGVQMTGKFYAEECEGFAGPYAYLFAELWDHLHGAGAWEANPWVVALTFSVQQRNIDQEPQA